ncbi:unnamed protein product (macronuclear) [Paramecium tetraurelia]|uniref:Transmembrane protein n=1 Tax=Paramecium tetraurelia TaxID=5888 RepID=A0CMZ3_PARTE|nr:uncharacterized protein GSPATT00008601001 [Paramecium tetraurelia]CAK72160.1 unnamed protein product [Paramecium tetraurelia]|eukprot:XP_001439557.1 hypothetical protein (macronuclear) [Paramecium tetraurelia strain d4-2]
MNLNSSMNETVSEEEDIEEIEFEFPSNDKGEKINSEEELLNKAERENIQEDYIESDAERKTDVIKTEEFEYYYEYIYEETNTKNIAEEILLTQEDSQLDFMEQTVHTDQNQQEKQLPHNESVLNISDFNIKQDSQQSAEDQNLNSQDSGQQNEKLNQTMTYSVEETEEIDNSQKQDEEYQKMVEEEEENHYIIVEEEEINIHQENQEQSQTIQNDVINSDDEQIIADPRAPEFNRMNQTINQEQQQSQKIYNNQSKTSQQFSNQIFSLYFDLVCYKDHKTIEQEDMIPSSINIPETSIPTQNINPILLVHTIILTLMLILVSINDKQNIKIKKEPIQVTSMSELSELNEYMAMMINGLEQQYNLISKSQEQLAYQLELLEQ